MSKKENNVMQEKNIQQVSTQQRIVKILVMVAVYAFLLVMASCSRSIG